MIDRLHYALQLCRGKNVADIGGARMEPDGKSSFDYLYRYLQRQSASYTVIDRDESADVITDLNRPQDLSEHLARAEVILCMETLEHLRNPGLICDQIAEAVKRGATAFISIPRTSWFHRILERGGFQRLIGWPASPHLYAFDDHHADIFIRHNFAGLKATKYTCLGRYSLLWPVVWLLTMGRGLSFAYHIQGDAT
jgi:hypothetical protein